MQPALHLDTHRVLEHAARSSKHAARSRELGTEGVEHVKCIRGEPTWPWGKHPRRIFRPHVYISRIGGTGTGEPRVRASRGYGRAEGTGEPRVRASRGYGRAEGASGARTAPRLGAAAARVRTTATLRPPAHAEEPASTCASHFRPCGSTESEQPLCRTAPPPPDPQGTPSTTGRTAQTR